jgi:hypothetical protein
MGFRDMLMSILVQNWMEKFMPRQKKAIELEYYN